MQTENKKLSTNTIPPDSEVIFKKKPLYDFAKRFFDILLSFIFLILFWWLIVLLLFIKWLEDANGKSYDMIVEENENGEYTSSTTGKRYSISCRKNKNGEKDPTVHGAIYTSIRIGKNGKPIKFHKIRSMCPGAEKMKAKLIELGLNEADGPAFKMKKDPRITKVGNFIRKTSLDELPQIWDIFLGRISIVGPRPPLPAEVKEYNDHQKHRLDVKGGLLCLWQITKNRNDLSFDEWVELDLEYIRKRSLWLDIKIICKAFWFVLTDHSGV